MDPLVQIAVCQWLPESTRHNPQGAATIRAGQGSRPTGQILVRGPLTTCEQSERAVLYRGRDSFGDR
jgi:hypothetical protein